MIGNGETLNCNTQCLNVPVILNNTSFSIDFFILPISGAALVLEIQWLKTLRPIITDYSTLQMQFEWKNQMVHLQGISDSSLEEVSPKQLTRLHSTNAISDFYQLQVHTLEQRNSNNQSSILSVIAPFLSKYEGLFQEHTTLPPARTFNDSYI